MDAAPSGPPGAETSLTEYLDDSLAVLRALQDADVTHAMQAAVTLMVDALRARRPVLVCGNGGSMADAQHIAGELTARFLLDRAGLPVMALGTNTATLTAWSNDVGFESLLAREVEAFGGSGGVLLAISTSGNSANVVAAAQAARARAMTVIAMTGAGGGRLAPLSDVLLAAPSSFTPMIQQAHQCLYHYLCLRVEAALA
ncbi:SIS domain-containing protein [Roseospira marina]|uniref:SIS domain-containing protein n=1 Tax=Roseospira marina TaxID=140057 RepID=A0A5M6IBI9_9PROT|nr:SIS domain-containing protein [Roseospira marina]KAA5605660.1 SIS domain-containing protein [Roseospira marina]MBB4313264.1 D-sedoheptulose 7-phosphate isomerase [Roseospira marina]MBB5085995.1 D-sedoheptulose 7-phosphate isomerase [Roseospira marina]